MSQSKILRVGKWFSRRYESVKTGKREDAETGKRIVKQITPYVLRITNYSRERVELIKAYISEIQRILDKSPIESIQKCIDLVMLTYNQNGQIFVMGNGGSAATANDLGKGAAHLGHRPRVISLDR